MRLLILTVFILAFTINLTASDYIEKDGQKYLADKILIKFKNDNYNTSSPSYLGKTSNNMLQKMGVSSMKKMFDAKLELNEKVNSIFEIKLTSPFDPRIIAEKLSNLPEVEWAEPYYIYELADVPDDPQYASQYALKKVQAEQAWDVTKGSTDIIIAIVDTGIYWEHPDLNADIWINQAELNGSPGVDDDNNGFVDDIRGWDFGGLDGNADNDPAEDRADHGTHVAGIAGGVTNNGIGVASIGYNCKIMAVKTSRDDVRDNGRALISNGYQGIVYAVDNGAKVVNCSWGSYSYSRAAQEIINYAVANGTLVVGAAGNEGLRDAIYPGNYKGALSVGYSNSSDTKDLFSNYGEEVDLFAPGSSVLSTWSNNSYASLSGSSMASPMVAGIAGLVFAKFPDYTPLQVAEQIRVNADNIDQLNHSYVNLLGSGRANAFKAVSNSGSKSVRTENVKFVEIGDGDGIFELGEKISVQIEFMNFLNPVDNLGVQLTANSPYVTIENASANFGSQNTLAKFDNYSNPFSILINNDIPLNTEVIFKLVYSDGSYSAFEWTDGIIINPLYKTTTMNDIAVTITSKGTIGYNDFPNNIQGDGFKYKNGTNILFEGGLMYGTSGSKMISSVRDETQEKASDEFKTIQPFVLQSPGAIADEQGFTSFNDSNGELKRLGILTNLHTYTFADNASSDFMIFKYIFHNTTNEDITNFYAGLFFDWDIDESLSGDNQARYDFNNKFGYAYASDRTSVKTMTGAALLSEGEDGFYAIANPGDTGFGIYDGFSDAEKWLSISNGKNKNEASNTDVSFVTSAGPYTIPANGLIAVAFSVAASDSLSGLTDAITRSREKYNSNLTDVKESSVIPMQYALEQNYPNPFNPTSKIKYQIADAGFINLTVYDILGREVKVLVNEHQKPGYYEVTFNAHSSLASGVYFCRMISGDYSSTIKMIFQK